MKLVELQKKFAQALMAPLVPGGVPAPAAGFIKSNAHLTARERLEIYRRSYWYRLIDSMHEDFPGLRAVTGPRAFDQLIRAYLADCPSRSFTLRDLGSRLESWLRAHPEYAGRRLALALDMIRLEWAHIEAWDAKEERVLGPEDLLEPGPRLKIRLQPFVRLLALDYPVDKLRLSVNAGEHETASNLVLKKVRRRIGSAARMKPRRIYVAVHRLDFSIYYRRLSVEEFTLLSALRDGRTAGAALASCCRASRLPIDKLRARVEQCFATWAELGWFSK
ncbi:MAG TPA: DNA-binding domain-containing protein [Bryobacteraceae bacterium]|nr:DNA-binding domain-containing protein [Bryobacteraceae bacterium]